MSPPRVTSSLPHGKLSGIGLDDSGRGGSGHLREFCSSRSSSTLHFCLPQGLSSAASIIEILADHGSTVIMNDGNRDNSMQNPCGASKSRNTRRRQKYKTEK
ncbi:unnamed protein product [Amoebophrya sp. A25]|nr:unnamed protein product [Amoebophrya sp. A25]|eukprot:GSA25T00013316001.1